MHIEAFYNYCLSFSGVTEDFPFDEQTLVFRVKKKMFALTNVDKFESINLKCDPVWALELRASFKEIQPGYHMNKKHWNTVNTKGSLDDDLIFELIKHSYDLVVAKLPRKEQATLKLNR